VEHQLRQILSLARAENDPDTGRLLARADRDLPPGFARHIVEPMADAAATLAQIVAEFDLQPFPASQLRTVRALTLSSLVEVEDTASRNLRGYGEVTPELSARLDPLLERLHTHLAEIQRALPTEVPRARRTP
jgi:hypothetical protein